MLTTASSRTSAIWLVLLVASALAYSYFYFNKHEHFLDWRIDSSVDRIAFGVSQFSMGPFRFEIPAHKYTVSEEFEGSAVNDTRHLTTPLLIVIWIGVCYLLASFTYFRRTTFIVLFALFAGFLISLQLDAFEIFGMPPPSKVGTGIVVFLFLGLGYTFHAFLTRYSFMVRWAAFVVLSTLLGYYLSSQIPQFPNYLLASGNFGLAVITILFVILVAEEIIYAILFVITQSKGNNSEKHFVIASVVYLLFLTLYFLKKAGIYPNVYPFVDPYLLLVLSTFVAMWSLKYKQEFFDTSMGAALDLRHLLVGGGLVGFGYLSTGFAGGNDPLYESFHYLIIYIHLGFGAAFFLYIILNFIDALIAGHSVYKIAYKERNFPYVTCRLVGLIAVAAFFFQANKEPLELTQAAYYNAMAEHAIQTNEGSLAEQYLIEGAIFGYNNHLSNYQLAIAANYQNKGADAALRFRNATKRYPTPQSFVNAAKAATSAGESQVLLEQGLLSFASSSEMKNNLAVYYIHLGRFEEALNLLEEAGDTGNWNDAPLTNRWKLYGHLGHQQSVDTGQFEDRNPAVQTNMLSYLLGAKSATFPSVDTASFSGQLNLHHLTLLNNAAFCGLPVPNSLIQHAIQFTYNPQLQADLKVAGALNSYLNGNVNAAVQQLDGLILNANPFQEGELANLLGLLLLEQGAHSQAMSYFEIAQTKQHPDALYHLATTCMELGNFDRAQQAWGELLTQEPRYQATYEQIQSLFTGEVTPLLSYYYDWKKSTPFELVEGLLQNQASTEFIASVWRRISQSAISEGNHQRLALYFAAFEDHLGGQLQERAKFDLAVLSEESLPQFPQTQNAFDETATIAQTQALLSRGREIDGFNLLSEASELYPTSTNYLKRYSLLAVELGLREYAEQGLDQLRSLMPQSEFSQFQRIYQKRLLEANSGF